MRVCLCLNLSLFTFKCRTFAWEVSPYMWIIWKQVSRGTCDALNFREVYLRATAIWINCASVVCNNILHSQLTLSLLVQLGKTNRRSCAQFVICQTGRTVFRQSQDDGETNGANKRKHLGVCCQQGWFSFTRGALLSLCVKEARSWRLDSLD